MLSLRELRRSVEVLRSERVGSQVERVVQLDAFDLVIELSGGGGRPARDRLPLLLCCSPGYGRVSALPARPRAPERPLPFAQFLRPRLAGARLREVALRSEDRQLSLCFTRSRAGEPEGESYELLLSLMGPRSNLYLLGADGSLLRASRPLSETRRDLAIGAPWREPESRPPAEGEDRFAAVSAAELLCAIERCYALRQADESEQRGARRLGRALAKARSALERKVARLERDAASAREAPLLERQGELLKANLGRVGPGDAELRARDFATGEAVVIPLDPAKSATDNLQDLFKKARKAERRRLKAETELGALAVRLEEIDRLQSELDAAGHESERQAFSQRPEVQRILQRFAPEARPEPSDTSSPRRVWKIGRRELATRLVPKRYRTSDGLEVWVGKNDEGNDVLTTRLARGQDLFFHLEGSPGSHVILRTERGAEPPRESLLEAAELAVHFSKQRKVTRAVVHMAAVKDVSKPRGAKHGLVWVHRGRNLQLKRSPERLQRILEARLDE